MFTHLIAAQNLSHGQTNLLATTQRFLLTLGGFHDLGQLFLRSLQQFLSFAAPLFSQQRIATSDQPLAWVSVFLDAPDSRIDPATYIAARANLNDRINRRG